MNLTKVTVYKEIMLLKTNVLNKVVTIWLGWIRLLFGSDRSPRRGDIVRACVRAYVWDILQNNSENEF